MPNHRMNSGTQASEGTAFSACRVGSSSSRSSRGLPVSAPSTVAAPAPTARSEEHTSELQSLMRISYAVFCLKKKNYLPCLITIFFLSHSTSHSLYSCDILLLMSLCTIVHSFPFD